MIDYTALSKPFPPSAVSWRSQSLTKDGTKALALAYIDARDVMRRLDDVCGPAGWQDSYAETGKGRSEEHTSELQSLMRISYAVFCLKKKITKQNQHEVSNTNNKVIHKKEKDS